MKKPHKHAAVIVAWANGENVEVMDSRGDFVPVSPHPSWHENMEYRIKPETKPDVVYYACFDERDVLNKPKELETCITMLRDFQLDSLKLTFDGSTGKLKSAEVIA